ncbi:hypothetical protein [Klebsiella pneumoniae]|uniref:hypothetical protein n=1 Tax=Klebsiella pneumoniae TaxID=573 RepID=UPI002B40006A|nr:hypothetical protein [Klebsiella pneumoniae]
MLQSVASREVNTLDSVVLSVTRIRRQYRNVLPESVELEDAAHHSSEVQQRVKARVSEIAAGFASAFGAQIDVFWYADPTALVNDARWADFASEVAARGTAPIMPICISAAKILRSIFSIFPGRSSASAAPANMVCTIRHLIRMNG